MRRTRFARAALSIAVGVGAVAGLNSGGTGAASATDPAPSRVDAGGAATTDSYGNVWAADGFFVGGRPVAYRTSVSGTRDPGLFQTQREGMSAYRLPVAADGTYRVALLLAELKYKRVNERVFDVLAEGAPLVSRLDVAARAGTRTALIAAADVAVADGTLDLEFVAVRGAPTLAGIAVTPVAPAGTTGTTSGPTAGDVQPTSTTAPTTATTSPPPDTTTTTAAPTTSTTAPSTTTSTTPPPAPTTGRLTWAPPALSSPETILVTDAMTEVRLVAGRDYIIDVPPNARQSTPLRRRLNVINGRNVVIVGGHVEIPVQDCSAITKQECINRRRGIQLNYQTGTVHVEGLLLNGPDISDGIVLNAEQATVQLQNVRVENVHARNHDFVNDNHPDIIEMWGGVKELRVDRFTGSSDYQGLLLFSGSKYVGPSTFKRTNIVGEATARYLFWHPADHTNPVALDDVWILPPSGRPLANTVWPTTAQYDSANRFPTMTEAIVVLSTPQYVHYPNWLRADGGPMIAGQIRNGRPPGGDFVPAGVAGGAYVSPGYGA